MAIILRRVKNAPLSIEELDNNFQDLDERIIDLSNKVATSTNISTVERNGNALWFISKTGDVIADVALPDQAPQQSINKLPVCDRKTLIPDPEIGHLAVFLNKAGVASVIFYDGTKWCYVSNNEPIV